MCALATLVNNYRRIDTSTNTAGYASKSTHVPFATHAAVNVVGKSTGNSIQRIARKRAVMAANMDIKDCATVARSDPTSCQEISKPAIDLRDYRAVTLPNGARFVLVQDKEAVFAAAAVNVQAGYMDDPVEVPGLAHFLEHAVHLGSDVFPEEATYKTYLAKHGGNSNASTGMVHTVFHLTILNEGLEGALARLAPFFISPLLNPESAMREVENVHAEFSRNCNSDERKLLQLRRSLSGGRYCQFSTGNITTLRDVPAEKGIHTAKLLRAFWDAHYTAGRITGCIVAPQPLKTLEQWVHLYFSDIRPATALDRPKSDTAVTESDHTSVTPCITNGTETMSATQLCSQQIVDTEGRYQCDFKGLAQGLGSLVLVSPQRQALRSVELLWLIHRSALSNTWKWSKPWRFLSHLLGHEGPGSLTAVLRQAGLCTDLSVGVGDEVRLEPGFMFWTVTVQLTEQGLNHVPQVIVAVYHALAMIKGLPETQRQQLWDEAAEVAKLRWEYADRAEPRDVARDLSNRAHYWETHHLLDGPALFQEYHGADVDDFLSHIMPDKMMVVVCAKDAAGHQPETEQWYGAKYKQQKLPQELISACQSALQTPSLQSATDTICIPALTLTTQSAVHGSINSSIKDTPPNLLQHSSDDAATMSTSHVNDNTANPNTNPTGDASLLMRSSADQLMLPGMTPPSRSWALPVDITLKTAPDRVTKHTQAQIEVKESANDAPAGSAKQSGDAAAGSTKQEPSCVQTDSRVVTPSIVMQQPGLKLWHAMDTSWILPKAYINFNMFTPLVYQSPTSWVTARLLVRLLDDLLQAEVYSAELLGTSYSMSCTETGFTLTLRGFSSVLPRLLHLILKGLQRLATDAQHVASRHHILAGKLAQQLTVWKHSNPLQHAEYAADHLLQVPHWHVDDSLAALLVNPAGMLDVNDQQGSNNTVQSKPEPGFNNHTYKSEVGPEAVCLLARQLRTNMAVEGLCYGNMDQQDAEMVGNMVMELLKPQGLNQDPYNTSAAEKEVLNQTAAVDGTVSMDTDQHGSVRGIGEGEEKAVGSAWPGFDVVKLRLATSNESDTGRPATGVTVRYVVPNPNPTNTNSAVLYICQVCDDRTCQEQEIRKGVLLDLLVLDIAACGRLQSQTVDVALLNVNVCVCQVIMQMASKRCFHALRTTQRLGYIVSLSTHRLHGIASLQVRVQTPDKSPDLVTERVLQWLVAYQQELAETGQDQFNDFKASLSSKLSEPARSLSDAASRAWRPISNRTYAFWRRQEKLTLLKQVDLNDLLDFYRKHILPVISTAVTSEEPNSTQQPALVTPLSSGNTVVDQCQGCTSDDAQKQPATHTVNTANSSNTNLKNVQSNALICELWGSKAVNGARQPPAELGAVRGGASELVITTEDDVHNLQRSLHKFTSRLPTSDSF